MAILLGWTAATARAQTTATELVGLFMQSCLPFAGDAAGLRHWAGRARLPIPPDTVKRAFLLEAPGIAFDASNQTGKFVLVSSDDGLCSCVTNAASGVAVIEVIERVLTQAGIGYRLVAQRPDRQTPDLHYREYLAARDGRVWRILVAVVRDPKGGQAMLTAGR